MVWLGENVLSCPWGIQFCGKQWRGSWSDAVQQWVIFKDMPDWEKYLPSVEYGVIIGRTVLELYALGGLLRRMSLRWRKTLERLWGMISKGYCLAREDVMRKLNSFCIRVSSAMRSFYVRACEKTMFSLHLIEWLECNNTWARALKNGYLAPAGGQNIT